MQLQCFLAEQRRVAMLDKVAQKEKFATAGGCLNKTRKWIYKVPTGANRFRKHSSKQKQKLTGERVQS